MSYIAFLMDWAQMSDLDFVLIHQNMFSRQLLDMLFSKYSRICHSETRKNVDFVISFPVYSKNEKWSVFIMFSIKKICYCGRYCNLSWNAGIHQGMTLVLRSAIFLFWYFVVLANGECPLWQYGLWSFQTGYKKLAKIFA